MTTMVTKRCGAGQGTWVHPPVAINQKALDVESRVKAIEVMEFEIPKPKSR
jgi:hypothetical protein